MSKLIQSLVDKNIIKRGSYPEWLPSSVFYLTVTGSVSYHVSNDSSDYDLVGFCIPPRKFLFATDEIKGFDSPQNFDQYQQHHLFDPSALGGRGRNYDISIYNIAKYFKLCADGNPNMVDTLYTPVECVLSSTVISDKVRQNRDMFLSKKCYHSFKGYSFSQLSKLDRVPKGKRKADFDLHLYDLKYSYHLVRLCNECEQILEEGTLDITRSKEMLKSIRRGEWTEQQVRQYFADKESHLNELYKTSSLPHKPQMEKIRNLLIDCIEYHYDNLPVEKRNQADMTISEIKEVLKSNGY